MSKRKKRPAMRAAATVLSTEAKRSLFVDILGAMLQSSGITVCYHDHPHGQCSPVCPSFQSEYNATDGVGADIAPEFRKGAVVS